MKEISLTQGYFAQINDEDYDFLMHWKWFAVKKIRADGSVLVYAARKGRKSEGESHINFQMHHVITGFPKPGFETDHKDGNGINNQKYNIHNILKRQNSQNRAGSNPSSQYPGISWHKRNKKWVAYIAIEGKRKHLGSFEKELKAAQAYKNALESIGENFVEGSIGSYL